MSNRSKTDAVMRTRTLDIPVADLPFEAGDGFVASVSEDGVAHIVVTVSGVSEDPVNANQKDGRGFLERWGGALQSCDAFQKKDHADDPRMLNYIEKYRLEG